MCCGEEAEQEGGGSLALLAWAAGDGREETKKLQAKTLTNYRQACTCDSRGDRRQWGARDTVGAQWACKPLSL